MKKKLTLSINDDLIDFAHDFSKETDQSISHIVEEYLIELKKQQEKKTNQQKLDKRIEKLYGAFEDNPIQPFMFDNIDQKKRKIDKKRPLPKNTLKSLRKNFFWNGHIIQTQLRATL